MTNDSIMRLPPGVGVVVGGIVAGFVVGVVVGGVVAGFVVGVVAAGMSVTCRDP